MGGDAVLRTLAKLAGPFMRPPRVLSTMTVADMFKAGRRRLDLDLVVAVVRAPGVDEHGVDQWRQACIKVHAQPKTGGPAGVIGQLPTDLPTFTGRREELARLLAQATDPHNAAGGGASTVVISAVEGMGGVPQDPARRPRRPRTRPPGTLHRCPVVREPARLRPRPPAC